MNNSFDSLKGKTCVITGGSGVIGSTLARGLASVGVITILIGRKKDSINKLAQEIKEKLNMDSMGIQADVLDKKALENAKNRIMDKYGNLDFLINCAGGNSPDATTKEEFIFPDSELSDTFFGISLDGFDKVMDLNLKGTVIPTMVFGKELVKNKSGVILNISSMNAFRPLTKIPAYSAAKASINNFTEWLAVHFAKSNVRVNAIAPGFFITEQNRYLLFKENGESLSDRGKKIINNTPMGRFGKPEELIGVTLFLLSDLASFITGTVIPVDGGFNCYSGV